MVFILWRVFFKISRGELICSSSIAYDQRELENIPIYIVHLILEVVERKRNERRKHGPEDFLEAQGLQPGRTIKDLRLTWNELAAKARMYRDQ